jgi:RimJ/RimL family protein N-acetyltransferase
MLSMPLADDAELRALEPWQEDEFAQHIEAAREYLEPWLPLVQRVSEPDGARKLLQHYADAQARGEGRIMGIWIDGKLSGGTLFRIWENKTGMCELGVWLTPEATGRGLITKACTAMIDWAFHVRGMHRAEWRCAPDNERSSAVARRLGMRLDGTLRDAFVHNDRHQDVQVWSVLATEWPAKR